MGRRKLTRVLLESGCNKDVKNKVCIKFYINLISPAPDTHEKIQQNCLAINPDILHHSILTLCKAEFLLLKLLHLFARDVLVMKKLEIEETKTTQYSTFKTDIIKVGIVFSISNFFITKTFTGK